VANCRQKSFISNFAFSFLFATCHFWTGKQILQFKNRIHVYCNDPMIFSIIKVPMSEIVFDTMTLQSLKIAKKKWRIIDFGLKNYPEPQLYSKQIFSNLLSEKELETYIGIPRPFWIRISGEMKSTKKGTLSSTSDSLEKNFRPWVFRCRIIFATYRYSR